MQEPGEGYTPPNVSTSVHKEAATTETNVHKGAAEQWDRFVGEKGKADRLNFYLQILRQYGCREVFNAALGSGTDTISLRQNGFIVTSNEIDEDFRRVAEENAQREGVDLGKVTTFDWRDLGGVETGSADAVLCMGNSFTYLLTREDQLKVLEEFRRILSYGGVLIIDERNYQDILDRREEILADPLANFQLRHKDNPGRAMYAEEGVRAVPTQIDGQYVVLSYYDISRNIWLPTKLSVFAFHNGELKELLEQNGFSPVNQYSDFQPGFDPIGDFYQYVATKS